MVAPPNASDSPRVVGRYMLFDEIAAGGMATVRFGRLVGEVGFSRTVAVKCLHPQFAKDQEFAKMFLDEAKLAARVRHPNVVPILDVVARRGELFLVMDYVQGESLSKLVRAVRARKSRIPLRIVASIIAGALDGLHAAHEAKSEQGEPLGIVHRDVSPQNVIVGLDGVSRVLDFGVAKAAGRIQTTRAGQLKGKLPYMAPEQLKAHEVDRRTDIYAASVVLWEALTGRRLFKADNEIGVFGLVLEGNVRPPSSVISSIPKGYDEVTLRGLHLDPNQRFSTAREMAIALEKVAGVASPREVGAWVEDLARQTLRKRAEKVAELESVSTLSMARMTGPAEVNESPTSSQSFGVPAPGMGPLPPPVPPPRRSGQSSCPKLPSPVSISDASSLQELDDDVLTVISDTTGSSIHLSTANAAAPDAGEPESSHSQLTSLSMAQGPTPQGGPRPGILAAVVGVTLLLAVALVATTIFALGLFAGEDVPGHPDAGNVGVAMPVSQVPQDATSELDESTPSDAGEAGATAPDMDAAGTASAEASVAATPISTPKVKPPAPPTPKPTPPPARTFTPKPPKNDCNPPYTIDSRGVRVPKIHCL